MSMRATSGRKIVFAIRLTQRRASDECGSAIMETAMSTVLFLTFLFGIFETGFALYTYYFISEAAREGARYAIVRGSSCTGFASACPAAGSDVQNYVQNLGFPGINPSKMTVSPSWSAYTSGSTCPGSPNPCNSPGNLVTVTVQYNFPLTLPFAPKLTYAMSSTSAMIIAQ
jgi:Flp pilus assembly protein TadG